MKIIQGKAERRDAGRRVCRAAAFAAVFVTLAGCSSVPDAVNPVEWYRGATGWFSDDDKAKQTAAKADRKPVPGADKPFPALSSVPEAPKQVSTEAERKQAVRSLAADRETARYTDEQIRRQTDNLAAAPSRPVPPPPSVSAPPAPVSAPPVAPAPRVAGSPASRPAASVPAPSIPSAPPPPPPAMTSQMARSAPPPPAPAPPVAAPAPAAGVLPPPVPRSARNAPDMPLVFGPPPADIAIAQGGGAAPSPSPRYNRTPSRAPTRARPARPIPPRIVQPQVAQSYAPTSRYAPRFPSGVPFVAEGGAAAGAGAGTPVGTVYFASGSSRVGADDRAAIRRVVAAFKQRGGSLLVVGHASSRTRDLDPVRHEMANFAISLDRANAVAREIVRLGVDPSLVRVSAVSDTQPVYYEVMPSGEAGNRRVEILIEN